LDSGPLAAWLAVKRRTLGIVKAINISGIVEESMSSAHYINKVQRSRPTIEGAGVHLMRAFGPAEVPLLDPFLLLDDFHSRNMSDYIAGFPWHPHRGIETVTYMIHGVVEHEDSIGNKGAINSGEVQWMTAGSGILHQEMPQRFEGMMQGFQLWVNLPRANKMMSPRYRELRADAIPIVSPEKGIEVRLVAGKLKGVQGPVRDLVVDVEYMDIALASEMEFAHPVAKGRRAFAYVFEGGAYFEEDSNQAIEKGHLIVFSEGQEIRVKASQEGARFLFASGTQLREPVAWGGPIVMNTDAELELAFTELREGNFIRAKKRKG